MSRQPEKLAQIILSNIKMAQNKLWQFSVIQELKNERTDLPGCYSDTGKKWL